MEVTENYLPGYSDQIYMPLQGGSAYMKSLSVRDYRIQIKLFN